MMQKYHSTAKPQPKDPSLSPLRKGRHRGVLKKLTKKRSFYSVNPHEPKAHKRARKYVTLPLSLPSREGKPHRPLWERVWVRGIFVPILYHVCRGVAAIILFILTFLSGGLFHTLKVNAAENTVIIVRSQKIAAYDEAIKGFEDGCAGENITIKAIYDLKGDALEARRVVQNIRDNETKPSLILAVGILAATFVKEQFPDVPIIFCMVVNHERFNLQGANITGISSEASVADQFTLLKEFLGAGRKNIGVVFDPTKTEKIVSEAVLASKKYEFSLLKAEVFSEKEVSSALKNIINKIDALWMIPDSTVITKKSLDVISKMTMEHRIPIFCTSEAIVRAGALISVSPDYTYTGIQAARIARTLLNSPSVTSLGIKKPDKLKLTLNTQTAEVIGISLSSLESYPDINLYP